MVVPFNLATHLDIYRYCRKLSKKVYSQFLFNPQVDDLECVDLSDLQLKLNLQI